VKILGYLKTGLMCLLLASLTGLVVYGVTLVREATAVVSALPAGIEKNIREQGDETRKAALSAITDTRREALAEIARTRGDLLARVDRLTDVSERSIADLSTKADAQLGTLNATIATNLGRANDSIAEVAAVGAGAGPILANAEKITGQVNDSLPLFLDCDHNPDCVFNRYVGVAQSTEKAMRAVSQTAPGTLKSVESTAGSVASIAHSWEKQTPLYVRAIGWAGSAFVKIKALFPF
jgi:hypothetical protein